MNIREHTKRNVVRVLNQQELGFIPLLTEARKRMPGLNERYFKGILRELLRHKKIQYTDNVFRIK